MVHVSHENWKINLCQHWEEHYTLHQEFCCTWHTQNRSQVELASMNTQDEISPNNKYTAAHHTHKIHNKVIWNIIVYNGICIPRKLEDQSASTLRRTGLHLNWKGRDVPQSRHWWRGLVQTRVWLIPFDITSIGGPSTIHSTSLVGDSIQRRAQTSSMTPRRRSWRLHLWRWCIDR
jgi:hypothetical protein